MVSSIAYRLRSALFGSGSSKSVVRLSLLAGAAGMGLSAVCIELSGRSVAWWQLLLLLAAAFDIVGGVAANVTRSASYGDHGTKFRPGTVTFAICHVHPPLLALLLPGMDFATGVLLWVTAVVGATAVRFIVPNLKVPVALAYCAVAITPFSLAPGLFGLEWLAPSFLLKLVAAPACGGNALGSHAAGHP